jgi:hypothetical protein
MSMTLGDIREEVMAMGHRYATDGWESRLDRFINYAARDVVRAEDWPCRFIIESVDYADYRPDIGHIKQVYADDGTILTPRRFDDLVDEYGDPAQWTEGQPLYYAALTNFTLVLYPPISTTDSYRVAHFSNNCWLDKASSTPQLEADDDNDRFLYDELTEAVTLGARLRALEDSDEDQLREAVAQRFGRQLDALRDSELQTVVDEPFDIKQTRPWY